MHRTASVKMFFSDLQRGDLDVIHHLQFSDGLQIFHTVLILHHFGFVDVNVEVVVVRVNLNLSRDKESKLI